MSYDFSLNNVLKYIVFRLQQQQTFLTQDIKTFYLLILGEDYIESIENNSTFEHFYHIEYVSRDEFNDSFNNLQLTKKTFLNKMNLIANTCFGEQVHSEKLGIFFSFCAYVACRIFMLNETSCVTFLMQWLATYIKCELKDWIN